MSKIILKNESELNGMREAGRVAANIRVAVAREIAPGVTTRALDLYARDLIEKAGARSAFINYPGPRGVPPFPSYTCISVNEEVVHGVAGDRQIQLGDIVSVDIGVMYRGFIGDNAMTVMVGVTDPKIIALVRTAEQALENAISKAVAGNRLGDISHAVESTCKARGFTVVRDFVGHGVGRKMHEPPQIFNFGPPGKGPVLREGMTLAIEPMVNLGSHEVRTLSDGWTVVTRDRLPSVHVEHSVAVHEGGAEILTLADEESR
ncbi:MAG: type I methionyl aminopeptidase [Kiritimatiellae bacterium]|nr:type I methionyl aminopeptidase [Kiritimatiellia bacterium]